MTRTPKTDMPSTVSTRVPTKPAIIHVFLREKGFGVFGTHGVYCIKRPKGASLASLCKRVNSKGHPDGIHCHIQVGQVAASGQDRVWFEEAWITAVSRRNDDGPILYELEVRIRTTDRGVPVLADCSVRYRNTAIIMPGTIKVTRKRTLKGTL